LDRPIVYLDTETATLLGAPHLLEIGAVRVVDGEAIDRFDTLVRPQVPIEAEATAIHGIPDDAVRDAPDAGEGDRALPLVARGRLDGRARRAVRRRRAGLRVRPVGSRAARGADPRHREDRAKAAA
jgi:hypothetical protein